MLRLTARFGYSNLRNFSSLEELNAHLQSTRQNHTLVYFRAGWNPQCEQADQQLDQLAAHNHFLQVIKVDSDLAPKIARHYGVKSEPEFVFCLYGD
jgi:thioredoxin-like negative regulator of GroEL